MPVSYIAYVHKSSSVIDKLLDPSHLGITEWEVDEAVILTPVTNSWWDYDPDPARGWRLMVVGTTAANRRLLVVLYPLDETDGTWSLGTAIRDD
jgi:hypothetical protein